MFLEISVSSSPYGLMAEPPLEEGTNLVSGQDSRTTESEAVESAE